MLAHIVGGPTPAAAQMSWSNIPLFNTPLTRRERQSLCASHRQSRWINRDFGGNEKERTSHYGSTSCTMGRVKRTGGQSHGKAETQQGPRRTRRSLDQSPASAAPGRIPHCGGPPLALPAIQHRQPVVRKLTSPKHLDLVRSGPAYRATVLAVHHAYLVSEAWLGYTAGYA
jgi:hypothetical protein